MGKTRDPSPSSDSGSPSASEPDVPVKKDKKRKRAVPEGEELEIDVNLPEPPSKKALRKAKKAKANPETKDGDAAAAAAAAAAVPSAATGDNKRSAYGVWIGNLPFSADKLAVRLFFTRTAQIPDADITRLHMPTPQHPPVPGRPKPANKGFAYVDFTTKDCLDKALAVSETLMTGRKVLIKDAKSFEGRPEKATATAVALSGEAPAPADGAKTATALGAKPPSKRVFVGNLAFDVTKDELDAHFSQAGEVEDVHMATFEDTGKCKGFAWVRFAELEAAEAAVKGYVFKTEDASDAESSASDDDDDDDDAKAKKQKKQKRRKWFINRLHARPLRCEFAEDAATRYKKRYGKAPAAAAAAAAEQTDAITEADDGGEKAAGRRRQRGDKDARQEQRRKKFDARRIAPGAALANAPRASGAIVEGTGKKISFDE